MTGKTLTERAIERAWMDVLSWNLQQHQIPVNEYIAERERRWARYSRACERRFEKE